MPVLRKVEYKIRDWVKKSRFLTSLYFKYFKKKEVGHGTMIN